MFHAGTTVNILHSSQAPVGGAISPSGREILLKTYDDIFYWERQQGELLSATLQREATALPYSGEPQGEAICWDKAGSGFYTLSEGVKQPLYYYSREDRDVDARSKAAAAACVKVESLRVVVLALISAYVHYIL